MTLAAELGVNVGDVLRNLYGLEFTVYQDEANLLCPNPKHDDHEPSCNVNLVTGQWHCYSCHAKGDILGLGRVVLGQSYRQIRELLEPGNTEARQVLLRKKLRGLQSARSAPTAVLSTEDRPWLPEDAREPYSYRSGPLEYLIDRGFTEDTLRRWGVRFVLEALVATKKGHATIRNSCAIPVFDQSPTLVAWSYRATDRSPSWQPRYLNTLRAPLVDIWFGVHLHGPDRVSEIVVTEGLLDAMWFDQAGIPALAGLGSALHGDQRVKLLEEYRRVTIFVDRDIAGVRSAHLLGEKLWKRVPTQVALYPRVAGGADPQDLASLDLELGMALARPWMSWKLKLDLPSRP